jgi:2-polyprenyl-3-methyl-5-hydroxy-6-metoxy-1,4-benzoquinol methylase
MIYTGVLRCTQCQHGYPILDGIPRFAQLGSEYVANFGWQWGKFRQTQIDQFNGTEESQKRFRAETGWQPENIRERLTLDVGCGSGRFSAVAAAWGARVVAVDLAPGAVIACKKNMEELKLPVDIVQASLYKLPFHPETFDAIYSLGVLQHTPDPKKAMEAPVQFLKPGGILAYWIYEKRWTRFLMMRTYLRPATQRLPRTLNWILTCALVSLFFPVALLISFVPLIHRLHPLLPISSRIWWRRLSLSQSWQWTLLDTFDSYSARYESNQREEDVRHALQRAGMTDIERTAARGMAVVARKPQRQPVASQ